MAMMSSDDTNPAKFNKDSANRIIALNCLLGNEDGSDPLDSTVMVSNVDRGNNPQDNTMREPLNLDAIIAKSRAKAAAASTPPSALHNGSDHNMSYKSTGSSRSVGFADEMTDAEREAAAAKKLLSAMGRGVGGEKPKLKGLAQKMILASKDPSFRNLSDGNAGVDDPDLVPPGVVLDLWKIVAKGSLDHSVDNKTVHSALETAKKYYVTSKEGRTFVDEHLAAITDMLLSQSPNNLSTVKDRLGQSENDYVEKGIRYALQLVESDLRTNAHKFTAKCLTLDSLKQILDYKDLYYEDSPTEVRMDKILVFQRIKGYYHLAIYFNARANTSSFPDWELVHRALKSSYEGIVFQRINGDSIDFSNKFRKEAKNMAVGVMKHMKSMKQSELETQEVNKLDTIISDVKTLYLEFACIDPKALTDYFTFCQSFVMSLLSAQSKELKDFGQEMLHTLIESIHGIRPVIGAYNVTGAGCKFVNGTYSISPTKRDSDGYVIPGVDVSYERVDQTTGKKLLLFLDTFDDGATWCISEEHDDEPVEPDFTDYYTVVAEGPQKIPPLSGWNVSDGSKGPPPMLQPLPKMVSIREEHKTIKQDLSKWILENKIPDLIIGTDIGASSDATTTSNLVKALDAYMRESSYVSAKMANLFVSILPTIQRQARASAPPQFSLSSSSIAAIEAAKQRLASAERWTENTSRALMNAQNEHKAATTEMEEARAYLANLDQAFRHSHQNSDRELSLHEVFETCEDTTEGLHSSVDSSITSATGADLDVRAPTSKSTHHHRSPRRSSAFARFGGGNRQRSC